jgi:hypothetical protein
MPHGLRGRETSSWLERLQQSRSAGQLISAQLPPGHDPTVNDGLNEPLERFRAYTVMNTVKACFVKLDQSALHRILGIELLYLPFVIRRIS